MNTETILFLVFLFGSLTFIAWAVRPTPKPKPAPVKSKKKFKVIK